MESEARYAWVGATVVVLFLALAGGIYWLSGAADRTPTKRYTVYFQRQSLEGLQIGSDVRMQGIKVGSVMDYTILPRHARTVRVILDVDKRAPVLEGAQAMVARNLLTGLAGIAIKNANHTGVPLMRVPEGERYPVIAEGVADIARVAEMVEDLGLTGRESLRRLNTLLSDDNQRALGATFQNLARLTGELRQTLPEANATLASARKTAEGLDATGAEIRDMVRASGGELTRTVATAQTSLVAAEQAMASARHALQSVERDVHGLSVRLRLSAELVNQEMEATGQTLRQAGEAMQAAGRGLAEPGRILYGPHPGDLGPGEDRP
ncbi:MAG: MlaD family protein [Thiobacillaceae bacterium]|jgi:phospholipid/cholesterol/gamma-HCH transport system substrate-binding protein|nr:MlaD family protein [Thiobacillaceae bacterium]